MQAGSLSESILKHEYRTLLLQNLALNYLALFLGKGPPSSLESITRQGRAPDPGPSGWPGRVGQVLCTAQQRLVLTVKGNRQNIKGPVNLREFRPEEAAAPGSCPEGASDTAGQS